MASANLFQQYLQPARSVADYTADMDKAEAMQINLQGQRRQNELSALTADQTRQTMASAAEDRNALQRVASTWGAGTSLEDRVASLRNSGRPALMTQADALEKQGDEKTKSRAAAAKDQAEADAKQAEIKWKLADRHAQQLAFVKTPQDALAYVDDGIREGSLPADGRDRAISMIQQMGVEQWKAAAAQAAVPVLERYKQEADTLRTKMNNDTSVKTTQMTNDTSRANNASSNAVQMRGQNISAASAAAGREQADRHFKTTQASLATKTVAASEDERKAAGWFSQADNAWKNMQAAMGGVDPKTGKFKNADVARPGIPDAIAAVPSFGLGEIVGNTLRSPERQKFNQGASSLSEAILRAATGAGVNRDEALQKVRELTPVFGEDASTTKQKMDSIPMYLNSLKQRAGRAMPQAGSGAGGGVVDFGSLK
jgi:hypothetical protein